MCFLKYRESQVTPDKNLCGHNFVTLVRQEWMEKEKKGEDELKVARVEDGFLSRSARKTQDGQLVIMCVYTYTHR